MAKSRIVAGRKGSGKTAIFFQVRDSLRSQRNVVVTDLKPESHQLSLFREKLLEIVDIGTFDHTLAGFWYFVILSEILLTIKRNHEYRAKFDGRALSVIQEIDNLLAKFAIKDVGDFTSRINSLGSSVLQEVARSPANEEKLSAERLTNVLYKNNIAEIRDLIEKHTGTRTQLVLLLDNIDKGWPTNGVNRFDVRLVRLLIEALDKIKRDFAAHDQDFSCRWSSYVTTFTNF